VPRLRDKVVVITGASAGIGAALARACAADGARVVLAARRLPQLEQVAAECRAAGAAAADVVRTDVAHPDDVQALVDGAVARHGRLDVMVNNAGFGIYGRFEASSAGDLDRILAVNVNGTLQGCRAAIPHMRRQGSGHLINVSSVAGLVGLGGMAAYCATKYAQIGLSQALRTELRPARIWVTAVLPVFTRTEFFEVAAKRGEAEVPAGWPLHSAERVAGRILRAARRRRPPGQVILFRPYRWLLAPVWLFPKLADWLPLRIRLPRGDA
jgi:3-oxoacyl-[acyl-carrier protein] reductase